jgi:hypothetical protein
MVQEVWSLSKGPSSSKSSSVSQHLVEKAVVPMQYSNENTLALGGDASLDHVV